MKTLVASALFAALVGVNTAEAGDYAVANYRTSSAHPRVLLAHRRTAQATLRIQFRVGSIDDGQHAGLTRVSQHAMLGSNRSGDFERFSLAQLGSAATLEIETGAQHSAFTLTAPHADFEPLAKTLLSMCLSPRLVDDGLEVAKSRTLQGQPNAGTADLLSMFARTVFNEYGYKNPYGHKGMIRGIVPAQVRNHVATLMTPANAVVIVTGRFSVRRMKKLLTRFRGGERIPRDAPSGNFTGQHYLRSRRELHLFAYPLDYSAPGGVAAARLAGAILQERILWRFRRQGVAYSTGTVPVHTDWLDAMMIFLPIHRERVLPVGEHLDEEMSAVSSGQLEPGELTRNKRFLLRTLAQIDRDPRRLADELAMGGGELAWFGPELITNLKRMDASDLRSHFAGKLSRDRAIHVLFSTRPPPRAGR